MADAQTVDVALSASGPNPPPATTKPVQPGPKTFDLAASEQRVKVGEKVYDMWTFNKTVPGPALRVVQGDSVTINLKNDGSSTLPHSVDFHAARINPGKAFKSILPGESISYTFTAEYPGVFMNHCGTPPVLQHIGMGTDGMIIVQPKQGFGAPMQEIALVQSELYTSFEDMQNNKPDAFAFNGVPGQYAKKQIQMTGKKPFLRIFFLNAGPSQLSSFHVVGTIFDRVFADGNPKNDTYGRQALAVPALGWWCVRDGTRRGPVLHLRQPPIRPSRQGGRRHDARRYGHGHSRSRALLASPWMLGALPAVATRPTIAPIGRSVESTATAPISCRRAVSSVG